MLLHQGLTNIYSQKKSWLHFDVSFTLRDFWCCADLVSLLLLQHAVVSPYHLTLLLIQSDDNGGAAISCFHQHLHTVTVQF